MKAVIPPWPDWPECPCLITGCEGLKLTRVGHVVGCVCASCRGARNQRKGKRGESNRHKRLGGAGWTPHDELAWCYSLNISTQDKKGDQVPAKFVSFVHSETARKWFRQAALKMPVGADALPALYLEPSGGGAYIVVDVSGRKLR